MNLTLLSFSHVGNKLSSFITITHTKHIGFLHIKNCAFSHSFSSFIQNFGFSKTIKIDQSQFKNSLSSAIRSSSTLNDVYYYSHRIFEDSPANLTIKDSLFFQCDSDLSEAGGGAIFCSTPEGQLIINQTSFFKCSAKGRTSNGGALLVLGGLSDTRISNCCFKQCSATFSGQAIFIGTNKSFSVLNQSTVDTCPYNTAFLQTAAIEFLCDHMSECVNESNSRCDRSPSLIVRGLSTCMMHFITLFNNTCTVGGGIFEIGYLSSPLYISAGSWNVIGCKGNYQNIGVYRVTALLLHFAMSVFDINENVFGCLSGSVTMRQCFFEKKLIVSSIPNSIIEENCIVPKEKKLILMSKICQEVCHFEEGEKNKNIVTRSPVSVSLMVTFCIIGAIFASLFKLYMKAHQRKNEKLYQQLAIPDVEI